MRHAACARGRPDYRAPGTMHVVVRHTRPVVIEIWDTMPGTAEVVWRLITDWEHQDDWMLEASDFVVTGTQREGVGVEAEATVSIGGIRTRDRVRVSGWDPPRRLEMEHGGWVQGLGVIRLTPVGHGACRLDWREELQAPSLGLLGTVGLTAFRPLMRRIFRRDLRVLRGLVRAASTR
jgi:Polyketide cyclase / dehydrase and lipid transport